MRIFPIIPTWIMLIICIILLFFLIKIGKNKISIRYFIILILVFLINLRIMTPTDEAYILSNNLDVLFVVDNTISMSAQDIGNDKTRLESVKEDCKYIIETLGGSSFSVITFNNTSKIATPYTKDANITYEAIDIIKPLDELYAKGTSLNVSYNDILNSLKSSNSKDDKIRIVFFISDGEITDDSKLKSFKKLRKYIDNGAVLGYGTKEGGYMLLTDEYSGETSYLMDTSGYDYKKAKSKINEKNLKSIANDMGIDYIHMTDQKNVYSKLNEIKRLSKSKVTSSNQNYYKDTYYILVIPLFILLIYEYREYKRSL